MGGPHNAGSVVWGIETFLPYFLPATRLISQTPLKPKTGFECTARLKIGCWSMDLLSRQQSLGRP